MEYIKNFFWNISKKQIISILVFCGAVVFSFLMATYGEQMSKIGYFVLGAEIIIITIISWLMAGHSVMKVLFTVSATGLSLLIFLAQSYCSVPTILRTQSGDAALMSLVGFGILYIGHEFFQSLRKEISSKLKILNEVKSQEKPWFITIPYGLFIGLFIWQIVQVVVPIINSLCVYK